MLYVLAGRVRTQGVEMAPGDAYVAVAGSVHTDFATDDGATYLSIFRLERIRRPGGPVGRTVTPWSD